MSWSRWLSYSTISAALLASACGLEPDVQVLGESTRSPRQLATPWKSAIFDGRSVRLRGARGETLGVQVRISDGKRRSIGLRLPDSVARVTSFQVGSLVVREPSTSMYGPSLGPGTYPDILRPVRGRVETPDLAYFDVAVKRNAPRGRYAGELQIGERVVPVLLDVSRARIDLAKNPLVWAFYLPREIARVHGLRDDDSPAELEVERRYHELFRAHGVLLAADLPPARFEPRRRFVRDTRYWPVALDTSSEGAIEHDVGVWLAEFRGTGVTPFAIPVDEPRSSEQKARAQSIAEAVRRAGGGRPELLTAVTAAPDASLGNAFDVFISPKSFPEPAREGRARGEHFWTYNGRPPEAGSMILDTNGVALRTWGWIAQRYDVELWYAWEALYFSDRYNRGGPNDVTRDPNTFDERRAGGTDHGNGDGLLAYPGPLPSLRLAALRRGLSDRLLLRALEACGGADVANAIVRRMVPRALGEAVGAPAWSPDESAWEQARQEVLDAIEVRCHDD